MQWVFFLSEDRLLLMGRHPDTKARVWDLAADAEVLSFDVVFPDPPTLAVTPDRKHLLAYGGGGVAGVWDLGTGKVVKRLTGLAGTPRDAAISPDGVTALIAAGDGLSVWNLKSGRATRVWTPSPRAERVAFAPDGKSAAYGTADGAAFVFDVKLVVSSCWGFGVVVWDVGAGGKVADLVNPAWAGHVALSPDGRFLALADRGDPPVRVYRLPAGGPR